MMILIEKVRWEPNTQLQWLHCLNRASKRPSRGLEEENTYTRIISTCTAQLYCQLMERLLKISMPSKTITLAMIDLVLWYNICK